MLSFEGTKVTDAGLVHLAGLTNLLMTGFEGSEVTDAGLKKPEPAWGK